MKKRVLLAAWIVCAGLAYAETGMNREARVDAEGVLRWTDTNDEVALLGVNYYAPFTVDYAELKRLGLDHCQAIRDDVAHFRRLGFGCIRVHCFDREFSDTAGNLVDNHHMEMLDFLVATCASNGIYSVMTPIAWWGGTYAPGDINGFSSVHSMHALTADRATWPIQARFLKQFAEHVNRFTGKRYADDPAILAFECINEPLYPKDTPDALVTDYINALTDGLRASGTAKPIYYNSWQGRNAAAGASRVDGVTCAYYPTGLVAGRELEGPQLNRVRASTLQPDASIARKSRMSYEFDCADVGASYMYPAMAKLFRAEGVQVAAQFQYDPVALADVNFNWQTHHLNLVYTPGKALAMAVAAEVFARVPRGTPYQVAEDEMRFPPFRVSVTEDLSEMAAPDAFIYSNTTRTQPPNPAALQRVWGRGSSPVVQYGGTGAYFLDRVAPGVWRLQIYPDVFTVADPYTGTRDVKVKVLPPLYHAMTINLPDLSTTIDVRPGDYVVTTEKGKGRTVIRDTTDAGITSVPHNGTTLTLPPGPRYVAPVSEKKTTPLVRARIAPQWRAGVPLIVSAEAALVTNLTARFTSADGKTVDVTMNSVRTADGTSAPPVSPYLYKGVLAGEALTPGTWGVTFRAAGRSDTTEYPEKTGSDVSWMRTAGATKPLMHIPAEKPAATKGGIQHAKTALVKDDATRPAIRLTVSDFGQDSSAAGYTLPIATSATDIPTVGNHWGLRVVARGGETGARVEIGFPMKNGLGLGCNLRTSSGWTERVIPATELLPLWGLPSRDAFRWSEVERVSILTGAWLFHKDLPEGGQSFDLAALEWVPLMPALQLNAVAENGTWSLFDQKAWLRRPLWDRPLQRWGLTDDQGRPALRLGAAKGFTDEHQSLALRVPCDGKTFAQLWPTDGADAVLVIRARAAHPKTTTFELALIEDNDVAWGINVPLTTEWQTQRIPVSKLRLFTHWDKTMTEKAGPHLRPDRLTAVNVCFGSWLFPQSATEPHAFEIAEIGICGK